MSKKCSKWNKKCSQTKFVTNRTKNVHGNKKCAREQKMCFCGTLWYLIVVFALYGHVWPCVVSNDLVWPRMVLLLLFTAMAMCGLIRFSMAFCDMMWSCMAVYSLFMWQGSWIQFGRHHNNDKYNHQSCRQVPCRPKKDKKSKRHLYLLVIVPGYALHCWEFVSGINFW